MVDENEEMLGGTQSQLDEPLRDAARAASDDDFHSVGVKFGSEDWVDRGGCFAGVHDGGGVEIEASEDGRQRNMFPMLIP